jgi:hypothetical protein
MMGVVRVAGVVGGTVATGLVIVMVAVVVIVVVTRAGTFELPIKYPTTPAMIINTATTAIKVVKVFLELMACTQIITNKKGYLYFSTVIMTIITFREFNAMRIVQNEENTSLLLSILC